MEITHSYKGIGFEYQKTRKGAPKFASFAISKMGFYNNDPDLNLLIVELGVGSGQQTEFIEKELNGKGITQYKILAYDKSYQQDAVGNPGQLNILNDRIRRGEISRKVIPVHFDFDGTAIPVESGSAAFVYMAHVFHHLKWKEHVLSEIARIASKQGKIFILGVTIEDLKNHPLDEFFPVKYEYDSGRYPTEPQLKKMFNSAGFTYEKPYKIGKDQVTVMDRAFLSSIEDTTKDSVLRMIKDDDISAFEQGVRKIRREVEHAEKIGNYRTYFTTIARVFWGVKK